MKVVTDLNILHRKSKSIFLKEGEPYYNAIIQFLKNTNAAGIAAVQLNLPVRVFGTKFLNNIKCYINPLLLKKHDEYEVVEGCLSIPNKEFKVKRHYYITVEDNLHGEQILEGVEAQIWQHEFDHLKGILISDIGKEV